MEDILGYSHADVMGVLMFTKCFILKEFSFVHFKVNHTAHVCKLNRQNKIRVWTLFFLPLPPLVEDIHRNLFQIKYVQ